MRILKNEFKQCPSCMEEHEVQIVEVEEVGTFKGEKVAFIATYEYCPDSEEYWETEEMMRANSLAQKDAYRKAMGLLTSYEIKEIRKAYDISQSDFSDVLGWGSKTITRYENHQVQDRAHDDIIRKIACDPKWFLDMLDRSRDKVRSGYLHYYRKALELMEKKKKKYTYSLTNSNYNFDNESFSIKKSSNNACFSQSYIIENLEMSKYDEKTVSIQTIVAIAA